MGVIATFLLALAALVGVGVIWSHFFGGFAPEPFRSRPCQGRAWKRAFPAASKEQVRRFLESFVESFAFRSSERLQFAPEDRIMAVYRSLYPGNGGVDGLELESLAMQTQRAYGVHLAEFWSDGLTFGELFAICTRVNREEAR